MKYILAVDQGTTSSRAILFDHDANIVALSQQEFTQYYPNPGWVEHNPEEIAQTEIKVMREVLEKANISAKDVKSIGITNQRETTIVWNKYTGKPIYNAIVWQCRRTAEYCDSLKKQGLDKLIYEKTGLVLDAYFSATKIKWILDNVEGAKLQANKGELLFGTIDTYLMWVLSNGAIHKTDYTNASRTMLFNIHTLKWDKELLDLFEIPESMLPSVQPSSSLFGNTYKDLLGEEVPITGVVGDQQSALFGHLCVTPGSVKNTYGTGCFLLMNTGKKAINSKNGLVTTLAASLDDKPDYVLEGSVFVGGAIVQWLRDEMKLIAKASESEKIATSVDNTNGVYIIPAFCGLGAPYWNSNVRGIACGLTRGTNNAHFVRAALESIDYQVYDLLKAMEKDSNIKITDLSVDGGACANNFLMQFEADITKTNVVRPTQIEVTAMGAAFLSGLESKYWTNMDELKKILAIDRVFTPNMDEAKRNELVSGWTDAVNMLLRK